jgi:tryptophan 2,3-dioxygenase
MEITDSLFERLQRLEAKFSAMGQDMGSYVEGLIHADYLTYWDYINLDALLSLQQPKTPIPDERIFVMYHQITELYFRLILDAVERIALAQNPDAALLKRQLRRICRYFDILSYSFDVMVDGMDRHEFQVFRMSLLPASGFQSAQFRLIEVVSTDFHLLTHHSLREGLAHETDLDIVFDALYWRQGATELATGKKTLTLKQFELKYRRQIVDTAKTYTSCNLRQLYLRLPEDDQKDPELISLLREHDLHANVRWPLSHYRSAVRHLESKPQVIAATGGTNWQDYLPPKNQRIVFYPELWTHEELDNWGKNLSFRSGL